MTKLLQIVIFKKTGVYMQTNEYKDPTELAYLKILDEVVPKKNISLKEVSFNPFFKKNGRLIYFWQKPQNSEFVYYSMQGPIKELPEEFYYSVEVWRGFWHETGIVDNFDKALDLIESWIVNQHEIKHLSKRKVKSCGIG